MGMYDTVNYEGECPQCGEALEGWQTKDGPCVLDNLEPHEVDYFYTKCRKCSAWIEAEVDKDVEVIVKRCDVNLKIST